MRTCTYFRPLSTLTLLIAAVSMMTVATAAPPPGKGGGGGGGEEPPTPPPVTYDIALIPYTLGGAAEIRAKNQNGDFGGSYIDHDDANSYNRGFLYTAELGLIDANDLLPEGSPWTLLAVKGINNLGTIVCTGVLPGDTVRRACRVTRKIDGTVTVIDLGRFHPNDRIYPSGINDLGEITGSASGGDGEDFIWHYSDVTGLQKVDLGVTPGNLYQPAGITNLGQIIGTFATETNIVYRVVPGSTPEFFLPPDYYFHVNDFNDLGEFVGDATFPGQGRKTYWAAYRHDGTSFLEITSDGQHPRSRGINNGGDVVGSWGGMLRSYDENAKQSFVYLEASQTIFELDDAVLGTEAELDQWFTDTPVPAGITESGEIIGLINRDSTQTLSFFKLTPTNAP